MQGGHHSRYGNQAAVWEAAVFYLERLRSCRGRKQGGMGEFYVLAYTNTASKISVGFCRSDFLARESAGDY